MIYVKIVNKKKSGGGELNCFVYLNVVFFLYSLFYSLKGWKVFLFYEIFFFLSLNVLFCLL